MPVTVVLGSPILSLVDAVIVQPPYRLAHRTIGGHGRQVSNLDFEVKNPDLSAPSAEDGRLAPALIYLHGSRSADRRIADGIGRQMAGGDGEDQADDDGDEGGAGASARA